MVLERRGKPKPISVLCMHPVWELWWWLSQVTDHEITICIVFALLVVQLLHNSWKKCQTCCSLCWIFMPAASLDWLEPGGVMSPASLDWLQASCIQPVLAGWRRDASSQPRLAGDMMFLTGLSVRLFICYQSSEHALLQTNKPILLQIGTSGPWGKGTKHQLRGSDQGCKQEAEVRFGGLVEASF